MLFKPALDERESTIKSKEDFKLIKDVDIAFIDEAQFLKKKDIDRLRKILIEKNIDIYCFGLKADFKGNLFKGSKRLLEVADYVDELHTMCMCGKKATMNLKYDNKTGNVIKDGEAIECGYEDMYMSVCYTHWTAKNIKDIK